MLFIALAVRRRAFNRARFVFIVATNCNLSCDWLVSVSSGNCTILRKQNAIFYWALSFTLTNGSAPSLHYVSYMSWCLDFCFFYVTCLDKQRWFVIYVCLLPLYQFIVTVEKLQYPRLSHYVSFINMIAGIRAMCLSLSLIKSSSHLKENIKRKRNFWFPCKLHWSMFILHAVVVLHFTHSSGSFFYS